MSEPITNPDRIRRAARPRGLRLVRTLVGLVRSLPASEASPLGQPTLFLPPPWLPYEADLTVADVPGEPADAGLDREEDTDSSSNSATFAAAVVQEGAGEQDARREDRAADHLVDEDRVGEDRVGEGPLPGWAAYEQAVDAEADEVGWP